MPMKDLEKDVEQRPVGRGVSKGLSRRAMLKGAVSGMPVVLTLQSGAALARSSNLISEAGYKATDRRGRTLCLDLDSVAGSRGGLHDLGEPAYAHVTAINEREYHVDSDMSSAELDEAVLCQRGGTAHYREGGSIQKIEMRPGGLVSATALTSFAGNIVVTDL